MELISTDPVLTITLPDSLFWEDEYGWNKVVQKTGYGMTGALFIQEGTKLKGRPITLVCPDTSENVGTIVKTVVDNLKTLKEIEEGVYTLKFSETEEYTVMFRNSEKSLDVTPLVRHNCRNDDSRYVVNAVRLMEVV